MVICEDVLNKFAITSWPEGEDVFMFFIKQKQKLAKHIYNIQCVANIAKKFKPEYDFTMIIFYKSTNTILKIVLLSMAIINNRKVKQIPIKETIKGVSLTDQRLEE